MPQTNDATKASTATLSTRALPVLAFVALGVYLLDQVTKYLVVENLTLGERVPVVGEVLQLRFVKNSGAAFSFGADATWVFSIVASLVAVFIIFFAPRIRSRAWAVVFGMLLGGSLGNLTDRLVREPAFGQGHVVDFLEVYAFPAIFNFADSAIVVSMGLFVLLTILGVGFDGGRGAKRAPGGRTEVESN